ncbi:glucose sorbosone dehydrogenase [Ectocarpus siliculosus]|uniref:Glucose sorbosone dehydrogenase n=1 Tax=Ectocarpus siliculosus TaxID=2880 RepID=D7G960_ECTSI|nr:glucose sorbosone dehydrogenase [Ectocarpus siliculosus]|eukprot:CBJ28224.1 glucose sorbosone dehydrogenase [Ectocarpus siliculosus]
MTMKSAFCDELVTACDGQIDFPTYDSGTVDYCTKHTGRGGGLILVVPLRGSMRQVNLDSMDESELVIDVAGPVPSGGSFYGDFEEGLLDVAFGPMFGDNSYPQYFYVSYTVLLDDGENQRNRLARFTYVPGDAAATRASEEVLLTTVPKYNSVHSAGWLGFKPSAYGSPGYQDLYWTTGDGGPQTDPFNHSQDGTGYTIPPGNYHGAKAEICAIGLRNPWRCSFDRLNDDLYCGDVGQISVEEINFIECGNNYGWSRFEGSRCQEAVQDNEFNPPCDGISRSGFTFPLFEYCHPDFDSTDADEQKFTGGADTCGNRFVEKDDGGWAVGTIISDASIQIISFAEDADGEIMLLDYNHNIYPMPCGNLCATICLDQAEDLPAYEICASHCKTLGSTFSGVQNSFQCFCGPSTADYAKHGSLSSDNCEYLCHAHPEDFCGGFSTMEVFRIDPAAAAGGYLGCFADVEEPRVFPESGKTGSNAMTTATCAGLCSDYAYYATQYGREVYSTGYLGCFADSQTGRVFSVVTGSSSMTTAECASTCSAFAYYGTQYGGEVYGTA